jgi:soluble lytic murein transglycosylase-like protein
LNKHLSALLIFLSATTANACAPVGSHRVSEMIEAIAKDEELDPALALAVAEVESASGKRQVSKAGAVGIMQLMPETASDYGVSDRCDPESNIRAGVRYLKKLHGEFDDPLLMLAAYNAGPARVYEKGGIPEFNETTLYIAKVMNRWSLNAKAAIAAEKRGGNRLSREDTVALAPSSWRDQHVWTAE